ncbi:MAG: hypothetical protein ACJ8G7_07220, partial [Rhizobacter sp.]
MNSTTGRWSMDALSTRMFSVPAAASAVGPVSMFGGSVAGAVSPLLPEPPPQATSERASEAAAIHRSLPVDV